MLAYSSVSQMGFLVAVLGMGLAAGDAGRALAAAFYAAHHVLVKGRCSSPSAWSRAPAAAIYG